jgi:integrase
MARSVYKICDCKDQVKCKHPWWFSFKRRGAGEPRYRKSLDVVLEKRIESKTEAQGEAERLVVGIRGTLADTTSTLLSKRERELLGLPTPPASTTPAPIAQTLTISQVLAKYRARHIAAAATVKNQAYQIATITRTMLKRPDGTSVAFGEWLVVDVTADTLEDFRIEQLKRDIRKSEWMVRGKLRKGSHHVGGPIAANRNLRVLRAAFKWAIVNLKQYVKETPFKTGTETAVKLTKEPHRSRRLQADEADRLLVKCGIHLRAIVETALETGCRRGELLGLQWRDVDLERRTITLPAAKTKTGKQRTVPVSTRLKAILEMRRNDPKGKPLGADTFVLGDEVGRPVKSIKTAWVLTCQRATITGLHFHDLRREAGSRWMDAGVPLSMIQKWLGHANVSQTSTYLATTEAGEHEAMRRFEESIGRLTSLDTAGGSPPLLKTSNDNTMSVTSSETTTRH